MQCAEYDAARRAVFLGAPAATAGRLTRAGVGEPLTNAGARTGPTRRIRPCSVPDWAPFGLISIPVLSQTNGD